MKHPCALALLLLSAIPGWSTATLPTPDLTVAVDGSGDFKTVQAAVASIPKTNTERLVVFIKDGTYKEKVRVDAPFVTLRGQSRGGTRIEFPQLNDDFTKNPDDLGRAVLNLTDSAGDFVLENLTVENTAGQVGPHAFTIYGKADRTVTVDCNIWSHGADTLSLWRGDSGRYYHARCDIRGSVDFICPRGWCYVTDCNFFERKSGSAAVWHDGHLDRDMKFVLRNCKFDGTNGWVLARHHADAQIYFLDCAFSGTLVDKPPRRVIYPLNGGVPSEADIKRNADGDKRNLWGERIYFWNCRRASGDFDWHTNNLATVSDPLPRHGIQGLDAVWTFAGKWNPETQTGPKVMTVKSEPGKVVLEFSGKVTVKGKPRLALRGGAYADYASGSGGDRLVFSPPEKNGSAVAITMDLNGGAIIATEAAAALRLADVRLPGE